MPSATTEPLMTLREVASICRVHYLTARHWVVAGKLRASRAGWKWLVSREQLAAFLANEPEPVAPPVRTVRQRERDDRHRKAQAAADGAAAMEKLRVRR